MHTTNRVIADDRLTDAENRITALLVKCDLVAPDDYEDKSAFPLVLDEVTADFNRANDRQIDVSVRWSKLHIAGNPIGRRVLARQLRAFANELEYL